VDFGRCLGDSQRPGDLFVRKTPGQKREHFALAFCELENISIGQDRGWRFSARSAVKRIAFVCLGKRLGHVNPPRKNVCDGGKNIGVRLAFRNEAVKSGGQDLKNIRARVRCRYDDEAGCRCGFARRLQGMKPN
jgi:hypothetical protein